MLSLLLPAAAYHAVLARKVLDYPDIGKACVFQKPADSFALILSDLQVDAAARLQPASGFFCNLPVEF